MHSTAKGTVVDTLVKIAFWGTLAIGAAIAPATQPLAVADTPATIAADEPAKVDTPGNGWGG